MIIFTKCFKTTIQHLHYFTTFSINLVKTRRNIGTIYDNMYNIQQNYDRTPVLFLRKNTVFLLIWSKHEGTSVLFMIIFIQYFKSTIQHQHYFTGKNKKNRLIWPLQYREAPLAFFARNMAAVVSVVCGDTNSSKRRPFQYLFQPKKRYGSYLFSPFQNA